MYTRPPLGGAYLGRVIQKEFLQDAKRALSVRYPGLTWDGFAELAGIEPRALKTYRMPEASPDYRLMPKVVRNAIESLVAGAREAPPSRDVTPPAESPSDPAFDALLPVALAALVMRQARVVLIDGRAISGVDRRAGDIVGLGREDRHAMALVSRARLSSGQSDVGAEIHQLLSHCTRPLAEWLPLPSIFADRLSDVVLLDSEEGIPTREAEELAQRFVSSTASLEELLFGRFLEQLGKSSPLVANGYYSRVREFVVRYPLASADQLATLTTELPSVIGVLLTQQFYEPVPEGWAVEGGLHTCAHCGNALRRRPEGLACRTRACAESLRNEVGARLPIEGTLRLTRGIRQYWQEPGFDEIRVFDELSAAGFKPVLYPYRDRVDIEVGEVGIDLKAYVSPELLAARIERSLGGLAHYRHKWLAVPDRLIRRVPAYLERLRAALGATPVRCLATYDIKKALTNA